MWAHISQIKVNKPDEFQQVLDLVKKQCINIYFRKREYYEDIMQNAYIQICESKIKITFKPGLKAKTYIFDVDGKYLTQTEVNNAVAQFSRACKIQRTKDILGIDPDKLESAQPILEYNPNFKGKAVTAYEYDLSAAYLQMLKLPLPDLTTCRRDSKVHWDEVGFFACGPYMKMTMQTGRECEYVFKLMDSPYIKWCERLEERIAAETDPNKKTDLKNVYRYVVGDLQNINPFWRAMIVERCNHLVESYLDETCVYWNTDGIVCTCPRDDIMNDAKYKWTQKHYGNTFKMHKDKEFYQWDLEVPKMKGPKKRYIEYYNQTHDTPWDILKDSIPQHLNHKYYLDTETLTLKENSDEK